MELLDNVTLRPQLVGQVVQQQKEYGWDFAVIENRINTDPFTFMVQQDEN